MTYRARFLALAGALFAFALFPGFAEAQLRVARWNISNYNESDPASGRSAALKTAIFGSFAGHSMTPDVLMTQEFISQSATTNFLNILNADPGADERVGGSAVFERARHRQRVLLSQE